MAGSPRALMAFNNFKDSLAGLAVGQAVARGLASAYAGQVTCSHLPLSDGGEGFLEALTEPLELEEVRVSVVGPLGDEIESKYGFNRDRKVAVVEMALASGLELVADADRNPLNTTTHGTGQLIRHACSVSGATDVLVGVGGSATNDGGLGALHALGVEVTVRNDDGAVVTLGADDPVFGRHLGMVTDLTAGPDGMAGLFPPGFERLRVACDVDNPFVGPDGATHTFGKQKGADEATRGSLEAGMSALQDLYAASLGVGLDGVAGAGAAGGLSGGLVVAGADLVRGIRLIGDAIGLEEAVAAADVVFTGEGRYDDQTAHGKTVSLVQELCRAHDVPVVVVCGQDTTTRDGTADPPPSSFVFDLVSLFPVEEAMSDTAACLEKLIVANADKMPPVLAGLAQPHS